MAEWIRDSWHSICEAAPTDLSTCQSEGCSGLVLRGGSRVKYAMFCHQRTALASSLAYATTSRAFAFCRSCSPLLFYPLRLRCVSSVYHWWRSTKACACGKPHRTGANPPTILPARAKRTKKSGKEYIMSKIFTLKYE